MIMSKLTFKKGVFSATQRAELKTEIIQSVESSTEMRKEIRRVFQQANRRIQNIESKELLSPAVTALNKGNIKGFSKFSISGLDWNEAKTEYAKAISFLRQPTSTAQGARQYNEHLKKSFNLTDKEFKLMQDKINDKLTSISDSKFVEEYLLRYKDFTGDLETEAKDVSSQIESEAVSLQNSLENEIERASNEATNEIEDILDIFKDFEL